MSSETRRIQTTELTLPLEKKLSGIQKLLAYYGNLGYDPRLFGSFGREASLNKQVPTAIHDGSDIDIVLMETDRKTGVAATIDKAQKIAPHDVLTNLFPKIDGRYHLKCNGKLFPIDEKVLKLRVGSLAGKPVNTFDPNLLYHFIALFRMYKSSHMAALMPFLREMRKNGDYLPEEMFKPFHAVFKKQEHPPLTFLGYY